MPTERQYRKANPLGGPAKTNVSQIVETCRKVWMHHMVDCDACMEWCVWHTPDSKQCELGVALYGRYAAAITAAMEKHHEPD